MTLTEKAAELRRNYHREWQRKNPDKVKAAQDRYWMRKAEQIQNERTDEQTTEE